jgi:hypothetical protein
MKFPLPPLAEQERIVAEAQRILSIAETQRHVLKDLTARLLSVRRMILEEAFQGQLPSVDIPTVENLELRPVLKNTFDHGNIERGDQMTSGDRSKSAKRSLHQILSLYKSQMSPEQLFEESGISIERVDDFYEELRQEVLKGRIIEHREGANIFLAAVLS